MKLRWFGGVLVASMMCLFLAGCGSSVDENKTPEMIREEAAKLDSAKIEAIIKEYGEAIQEKAAELEKVVAELKEIPLKDQLGDEARKLQERSVEIGKSLEKLKANLEAYKDALTKK